MVKEVKEMGEEKKVVLEKTDEETKNKGTERNLEKENLEEVLIYLLII